MQYDILEPFKKMISHRGHEVHKVWEKTLTKYLRDLCVLCERKCFEEKIPSSRRLFPHDED